MTHMRFTEEDFNTFTIEGLDARMEVLKEQVRPKLTALGEHFAPSLSALTGDEMFPHVAKHARRSVNPPADSWVAFANSKRGYKNCLIFKSGCGKLMYLYGLRLFMSLRLKRNTENCSKHSKTVSQKNPRKLCLVSRSYETWRVQAIRHGQRTAQNLVRTITNNQKGRALMRHSASKRRSASDE